METKELYKIYKQSAGVCIDSRHIEERQLFFAFRGENTDGHQYVDKVLETEGCYAIIDDAAFDRGDRTILVEDVLSSIQKLARYHRDQFDIPVLGITGSNGKTTTKELIAAALSPALKLHVTQGNYNNHLGVPLTLLALRERPDVMIIEMGANRLKDIEELSNIADPTHGLITNIGTAHIEGFGSQHNILIGKTELYEHIADNEGTLFINKNDSKLLSRLPENVDVRLYPMDELEIRSKSLFIEIEDKKTARSYTSALYGIYNALNIHAAMCVAEYFSVDRELALKGIAAYQPEMNRSQVMKKGKLTFIMDAYNANPSSMKLSIEHLGQSPDLVQKVLILGDMLELGEDEVEWHRSILNTIADFKWHRVILIGPLFKSADAEGIYEHFDNIEAFNTSFFDKLKKWPEATILLKGSRSMQLEKILEITD